MSRCRTLPVLLGVLLAMGCSHQPTRDTQAGDSSLQRWLDSELAPYLAKQLGEHPRFRNESVILVRLDGPDIQPDIDGLTRNLRDQLMDSLLADAGVRVPWQPGRQAAQHHRRLDQVQCGRIRDADYYIGIEITRSATAQYRVSVRALDVRAGEWVSGFGKSWSGTLTTGERQALQERRRDESLRGLRVLPFSAGDPDLAATYLANNLSCLLRQQDEDDLVIYVESLESDQARLRTLLSLIGNNLSRYRELRVTDTKEEANFLLRGEAYEVQSGLYQVWVVLHPKHSGEHLSGMDTATYVRIQPEQSRTATRSPVKPVYAGKPAIASMELVRRRNANSDCARALPDEAQSAGCAMLELTVEQARRVFVFVHGTRDGISRLSSGTCADNGNAAIGTQASYRYEFPSARFPDSDWPTVYAIAVNNEQLANTFEGHLQNLPDACGPVPGLRAENLTNPWLVELDQLIANNSDKAVWTARRIP